MARQIDRKIYHIIMEQWNAFRFVLLRHHGQNEIVDNMFHRFNRFNLYALAIRKFL